MRSNSALLHRCLHEARSIQFPFLSKYSTYQPPYHANVKEDSQPVHKFVSSSKTRPNRIHVCGFSRTGALGCPELTLPKGKAVPVASQSSPYLLRLDDISYVDCGYGFTVFASKKQSSVKVWGCGVNTDSQLGFHKNRILKLNKGDRPSPSLAYVHSPSPIPLPLSHSAQVKVTGVACGRAHTLVMTDNAGIFSFGNNAFGQCGRAIIEGEIYNASKKINRIVPNTFPSRVSSVVCGMDHSLFLTESGEVFSCGWGADGQTGLGVLTSTSVPTKLKGDIDGVKIVKVSSFADTSLALSDEGQAFGWGSSEYRQFESISEEMQIVEPKLLPFEEFGKIVDIAASGTSCLILNESGEVFVWGYGILGKGPDLEHTVWPSKIPMTLFGQTTLDTDVKVTRIKAGLGNFAAITNKGDLFTWGENKNGCLGIKRKQNQFFPWRVFLGTQVTNVFCGVDHTVIMSKALV